MIYFAIVAVLLVLDQGLKWYMTSILPLCVPWHCESIHILPVLKFTMLHNTGAAFSILSDAGGWQRWFLTTVSCVVCIAVVVWLVRIRHGQRLLSLSLAFILGGALGNLTDRMLQGYVVDFIVVYYQSWYFPAFNIADSAITVGAGLMILDILFNKKDRIGE